VVGRNGTPDLRPAPAIYDHAHDKARGAISIVGVKYTTARAVAQRTVDTVARRLGRRLRRSMTAVTVLPGAGMADHEALAIETARRAHLELPANVIQRLSSLYAERSADIIRLMVDRPELRRPVVEGSSATAAEIVYVIRDEMAVHLSDIVVRRTGLGGAGHPGVEVLSACAQIAAAELGWSEQRQQEEAASVADIYAIP